jgi:cell division protein ZapB
MDQDPKHKSEENKPSQPEKTNIIEKKSLKEKDNKNRKLIIGISILFVVILALQFYFNQSTKKELTTEIEEKGVEIDDMLVQMDSLSREIDEKITTIEELGGDVEELKKIREELEAEKTELKKQSNIAWSSYRRVKEKVDGYQVLLKQKDEEIVELKAMNEQLFTENTTLKTEKMRYM